MFHDKVFTEKVQNDIEVHAWKYATGYGTPLHVQWNIGAGSHGYALLLNRIGCRFFTLLLFRQFCFASPSPGSPVRMSFYCGAHTIIFPSFSFINPSRTPPVH